MQLHRRGVVVAIVVYIVFPKQIGVLEFVGGFTLEVSYHIRGRNVEEPVMPVFGDVPVVQGGLENFIIGRVDFVVSFLFPPC